jgi:WD40 repeat protein
LASGSYDGNVKLWDAATGKEQQTIRLNGVWVKAIAFSPDGKRLAIGGALRNEVAGQPSIGIVKLRELMTGNEQAVMMGHTNWVLAIAFSPDGRTVATGNGLSQEDSGRVTLWDAATGRERVTLEGQTDRVYSLAFSPDGKTLATGGRVRLWDVNTGKILATLETSAGQEVCVAFSPDGKILVTANGTVIGPGRIRGGVSPSELKLWDVATGQVRANLKAHHFSATCAAFSHDGRSLAVASTDGSVKLWNVATRQEMLTLQARRGPVLSLAFAPDGTMMATSAEDGTVRLWRGASEPEMLAGGN